MNWLGLCVYVLLFVRMYVCVCVLLYFVKNARTWLYKTLVVRYHLPFHNFHRSRAFNIFKIKHTITSTTTTKTLLAVVPLQSINFVQQFFFWNFGKRSVLFENFHWVFLVLIWCYEEAYKIDERTILLEQNTQTNIKMVQSVSKSKWLKVNDFVEEEKVFPLIF